MEVRAEPVKSAGRHKTPEGISIWKRGRITAIPTSDADPPFEIRATLELQGAQMVVSELAFHQIDGGPGVTAGVLREIELAGLIRQGLLGTAQADPRTPVGAELLRLRLGQGPDELVSQGPTDRALAVVAAIYRLAVLTGDKAPTNRVSDELQIPRSTAGRWLVAARKRDILGPTTRGRAGEHPEED